MLVIRDSRAVSATHAASLAHRFQRALELEAQIAGYVLRSFEVQIDRPASPSTKSSEVLGPAGANTAQLNRPHG